MEYFDMLRPSAWEDRTYIWVYLIIVIIVFFVYFRVQSYLKYRAIYAASRVNSFEVLKKKSWNKVQMEIDPNVKEEGKEDKEERKMNFKSFEDPKEKRFKKIFGMDSLANRNPCASGK